MKIQDRHFTLSAEDIALINPNTRTCPIFRFQARCRKSRKAIYRKVPVLIKDGPPEHNPWKIRFQLNVSTCRTIRTSSVRKSKLEAQGFRASRQHLRGAVPLRKYLPLYEAKMMYHFTHRYGDYAMRPEGSLDSELPRIPGDDAPKPELCRPTALLGGGNGRSSRRLLTCRELFLVIQAVEARSEDLARQILSAWYAGYAVAQAREEAGSELLIRNLLSVWDSMEAALQKRFAAMALHEEYPLDESDFFWDQPDMTYLEAADRLIRKRTPKWLIGFRDICRATDVERTAIFGCSAARVGVGHTDAPSCITGERPKSAF